MAEIRNFIIAGLAFGLIIGIYLAFQFGINYALIAGPVSGFAFGALLYFFVTSKIIDQRTQVQVGKGEKIIYYGGANHFVNGTAVGGKLYLLSDKLQFQSHQSHSQIIELKQIEKIDFFNTFYGLIPNGSVIKTLEGKTEKIVVNDKRIWKEQIEELMNCKPDAGIENSKTTNPTEFSPNHKSP